jgi:uncharacterized protein (DUF2384 family)
MARPTKLDNDTTNLIVAALEMGLPVKDVCAAAGIAETSYFKWLRIGKRHWQRQEDGKRSTEEELRFARFAQSVIRAREGASP